MNASLQPQILIGEQLAEEPELPLATEDVQCIVWQSAFGPMLIEVRDGAPYVNGMRVLSVAEMAEVRDAERPG